MKQPANDQRSWNEDDWWLSCGCGCAEFVVRENPDTGLLMILCRQCEADYTMPIYEHGGRS